MNLLMVITEMNKDLLILGAGGHAKVVIETARRCGYQPVAVYDDDESLIGTNVSGVPVLGKIRDLSDDCSGQAIIAIGSNRVRKMIAQRLKNLVWPVLLHPTAYICSTAIIGSGTVVFAGAVIQPDVVIGRHAIVNTGGNVDHDCVLEDYVHICPGCSLAGAAKIGEGTMLGTGSSVIPLKLIGAWSTIGAGAAVVSDIPPGVTAVGVPARICKV